ncbi:unnamed protein product [Amoebophrya sp. A25]|nr:unnamed protein product [Amoebophrya sp. A25]|eukprot:GSA25T00008048001.1
MAKNWHAPENRYFTPENVAVPNVYGEHCRERVLVMELLKGVKLEEGLFGKQGNENIFNLQTINDRIQNGTGGKGDGRSSSAGGDPNSGNTSDVDAASPSSTASPSATSMQNTVRSFLLSSNTASVMLLHYLPQLLAVTHFCRTCYYQFVDLFLSLFGGCSSIGGGPGTQQGSIEKGASEEADKRRLILNARRVSKLLLQVHGEQIFRHGLFQGDCHPGNFLLLEDGRIGLIDFGQAKRLSLEERQRLARLMIAIADNDAASIVRVMREEYGLGPPKALAGETSTGATGEASKRSVSSDFFLEKLARSAFGALDANLTDGKPLQEFSNEMRKKYDRNAQLPGELYLPMRTAILLRGIGLLFGQFLNPAESWREMAEECLRGEG